MGSVALRVFAVMSVLSVILLLGCSNGFEDNYVPQELGKVYAPTPGVQSMAYSPEKLASLKADGFRVIGTSNFIAPKQSAQKDMKQAVDMGKKAGAEVVLYENKFHDKTTQMRQVTNYQSGQTVKYKGRDGRKTYEGKAESDGTYSTEYVPVSVDRYERTVYYLRKAP